MNPKYLLFLILLAMTMYSPASPAQVSGQQTANLRPAGTWDVFQSGAKGDGITMDTKAIQAAIDQCHQVGGGKVYLHNGTFLSGTIYLKSNVTLYIEAGATLLGSANVDDYPIIPSRYPSYTGELLTNKMLIYAEDARAISLQGRGTIDGRGDDFNGPYLSPSFSGRPRIIHFRHCENVQVRDLTLYNSGSWVQSYQSCKNLVIDGITVDSRENKDIEKPRYTTVRGRNTDGLDLVDCERVRISNCVINSGDDAICLKSFSPDEACRDITITNCIVSSNASGIKIGTETSGAFEDITISNCTVYDTRVDGISIMTTDGARVERITVSNITMRNIKGSALFIRLGNRNRPYRKDAKINIPYLKDIIIENIQGNRISAEQGCSITGLETAFVENITLRNINLSFEGGKLAAESNRVIPEQEKAYPNGLTYGTLPAYGLYVRHARNLLLDNIRLSFQAEDQRPALVFDDVEGANIQGLKAEAGPRTPSVVRLSSARKVIIGNSTALGNPPVFLAVTGNQSKDITLINNDFQGIQQNIILEKPLMKSVVQEYGTIGK